MKIAQVSDHIWVGHKDVCDQGQYPPSRRIHIWRSDHPTYSCQYVVDNAVVDDCNLKLHYRDGEPLSSIDIPLEDIREFIREDGSILIHCMAGQTRSPMMAAFALCCMGGDPYQAIATVLKATWEGYGVPFNVCLTPMQDLLVLYRDGFFRRD